METKKVKVAEQNAIITQLKQFASLRLVALFHKK